MILETETWSDCLRPTQISVFSPVTLALVITPLYPGFISDFCAQKTQSNIGSPMELPNYCSFPTLTLSDPTLATLYHFYFLSFFTLATHR